MGVPKSPRLLCVGTKSTQRVSFSLPLSLPPLLCHYCDAEHLSCQSRAFVFGIVFRTIICHHIKNMAIMTRLALCSYLLSETGLQEQEVEFKRCVFKAVTFSLEKSLIVEKLSIMVTQERNKVLLLIYQTINHGLHKLHIQFRIPTSFCLPTKETHICALHIKPTHTVKCVLLK